MADVASPAQALAPKNAQGIFEVPVDIVGSNTYGRYHKVSGAQTYNMMISDGWLVDYAGFKFIAQITTNLLMMGRGAHVSTVFRKMYVVVGNIIVSFDRNLIPSFIGGLVTTTGEVYIAENNAGQVAFSDGVNIYIYDQNSLAFNIASINFTPGFLSFQNTYFLCQAKGTPKWRLSANNNGLSWPTTAAFEGQLQTKPDNVQAVVPMPGHGNMLFVFGETVAEQWTFTGGALFPYSRNTSFNIDYGCINPSSIAFQGDYIVWIGISEEAGPVIMYTNGGSLKEVSTDGIDYLFSTLTAPEDCSGFLVKLDGHLFYQVTFNKDNLTLALDLTNDKFFTITDERMNYHPARKIVYFNNTYYFVSFTDPNLYEFGTQFTSYMYKDRIGGIPRVRICSPVRLPTQRPMIFKSLGFTIEQGQPNFPNEPIPEFMITEIGENTMQTQDGIYLMVTEGSNDAFGIPSTNMTVFLAVSRDGAETFGNNVALSMNATGKRKSRFVFQRLGRANDFTPRLQFIGNSRYVVGAGVCEVYL